jgi:hypothetical protein
VDFRRLAKFQGCIGESTMDFRQLSRNNINIGCMSELKLMLLEYIYLIAYTQGVFEYVGVMFLIGKKRD